MADLSEGPSDRGQMLIVGALALAVVLVALATVVNSAIYTENLASRGGSYVGSDAPREFVDEARRATADTVGRANENHDTLADQSAAITDGVADYESLAERYRARDGVDVDVAVAGTTDGSRINQSTAGQFTNASGEADWTVAADDRLRAFDMRVDATNGILGDAFTMVITDDAATPTTWEVTVYDSGGDTVVDVDPSDGPSAECRVAGETGTIEVNVTGARVGGEHCPALDGFERSVAPYDLDFEDGDEATGTYRLVVDDVTPEGDAPREDAVYDVTISIAFDADERAYETQLRVAPGEIDGE